MTEITTVAELDALPVGSVVTDFNSDRWRSTSRFRWSRTDASAGLTSATLRHLYGPLRVVEQPDLHMTKCVHDACVTTYPLPPGSDWLCPEHACDHDHITLGGSR